ncbi:MAG: glycosyltransferase [Actinomycetales bacterium]|nr:glycosyltransferase [Actinomycetales bacterium]
MRTAVSVITVVRNDVAGLEQTAASVLAQDLPGLDFVVIDGSDTDETSRLHDSLIAKGANLSCGPDKGIYDAMTKGVALAKGDYLVFMNAGDFFADGSTLSTMVEQISSRNAQWGYCRAQIEKQGSKWRAPVGIVPYSVFRHAYLRAAICHQSVMMRRDFFLRLGGFKPKYGLQADVGLLLAAGRESSPVVVPIIGVRYDAAGASSEHLGRALRNKSLIRKDVLQLTRLGAALDYLFTSLQVIYVLGRRCFAPMKRLFRRKLVN